YGLDAWRYYLTTQGPLGASDANFAAAHFHDVYSKDLVNVVGNCPSRVTAMIGKYFEGRIPELNEADKSRQIGGPDFNWPALAAQTVRESIDAAERFELQRAIEAPLS